MSQKISENKSDEHDLKIKRVVLWISRHQMTDEQFNDLERVLQCKVELLVYADSVKDISDLEEYINKADAVAAVLPSHLLSDLWRRLDTQGKVLLEAVSGRVPTGKTITLPDGRTENEFLFKHTGWKQIVKFDYISKML